MRKNWFNRLLLSYFPVLFVVSLSLLFITYLVLSEMSQKSAVRANDMITQHTLKTIDDALLNIDRMMMHEISSNSRIKAFFNEADAGSNRFIDYQSAAALQEIMNNNRFIESLYLYRVTGQTVVTPTVLTGIEQFGDKEFIGRNVTSLKPHYWVDKRRYTEEIEGEQVEVISLVKIANLSDRSLFVVNVSTDRLAELVEQTSDSPFYFAELVNGENKVIVSKQQDQMTSSHSEKGKLLSSIQSDYTGWTVRSGIYRASMMDWVSSLFYLWITFGCVVIVLGCVWLIYVTRRNYKPILTVINRIAEYSKYKSKTLQMADKEDEMKLIERTIESLLDESSQLYEENKENLIYRKRHIFRAMLEEGAAMPEEHWLGELRKLGMESSFQSVTMMLIEIDHYSVFEKSYSRRDQHLLKYALSMVCQEISDNESMNTWAEWIDQQRMAVIGMSSKDQKEAANDLISLCHKLQEWVARNLVFTVTIGLGSSKVSLAQISSSYWDAVEALTYKLSLGANRIIGPDDIAALPQGEVFRPMQHIREICQLFRTGNNAWEQQFQELYNALSMELFSRDDLISLTSYFINNLHKEVMELPKEFHDFWNEEVQGELKLVLADKETIDEIYRDVEHVLKDAFEQMREVRENRNHHQLIHQIKKYINEHYDNPDLSLTQLSGEFNVTASYISRLFKEEFGEKFNDYVAEIRIGKAKQLLKETDAPIHEVAVKVGYTHALSFIRVFKKVMGSTPGNYRKDMI
ncbi:helix-turn-helix domain-containing protein [Paenibacillus agaridevorans]|nr:helix-turn-helix domain-containing protein [Paenibacillus agaridevorans]